MLHRSSRGAPTTALHSTSNGDDIRSSQRRQRKESTHDVIVLGDKSVGKSALVVQLMTRKFIHEYDSSTDLLYHKDVFVGDHSTKLGIWDVVSKDTTETAEFLDENRDASGVLLVYSVADRQSFGHAADMKHAIDEWHVEHGAGSEVPVLLVGNKADSMHGREVSTEEGFQLAQSLGCHSFREVSALSGHQGISDVFSDLILQMRGSSASGSTGGQFNPQNDNSRTQGTRQPVPFDIQQALSVSDQSRGMHVLVPDHYPLGYIRPKSRSCADIYKIDASTQYHRRESDCCQDNHNSSVPAGSVASNGEGRSISGFIRSGLSALKHLTPKTSPAPSPKTSPRPSPITSPRPSPGSSPRVSMVAGSSSCNDVSRLAQTRISEERPFAYGAVRRMPLQRRDQKLTLEADV